VSAIILHHYPLSPYSEKARLAMGLKGLAWNSVEIPVWTPRPKLTPMTGGYRRTPILQIGADFYCDTLLILAVLEQQGSAGSLYPSDQAGLARAFGWWIEKGSFMNAVCLTLGNLGGKLPQELIDERRPFFGVSIDPADLLPKRGTYLQRFNAHIAWLADALGDGRRFILGASPSAADLSAYHPIWFARQNGGPEITDLLGFSSVVGPWYERVAAIGHGQRTEMTPEQAIEAARSAVPRDLDDWSAEAQSVGLRRGDWVSVTPDDYGNPVAGRLFAWSADEVVLRHEDASVGAVNLHFPRVGFDVVPEQRLAA
jgi:glutathione S-transferase